MNISRLSTLSLTLAIAVITLGYANSSFAGPDCERHPTHESCGGGGAQTTYTVNWQMVKFPGALSGLCTGDAVRGLSVNFPSEVDSCPVELDSDDYCVCQISVRNNKKGTDLIVFVHKLCGHPHCGTDVWQTGRLPAALMITGPGDFTIAVTDPVDVELTKINQPGKGIPLGDTITVGDLIYTED